MGVPAGGIPWAVRFTKGFCPAISRWRVNTRTLYRTLKACGTHPDSVESLRPVPRRPGGEGSITPGQDCRDERAGRWATVSSLIRLRLLVNHFLLPVTSSRLTFCSIRRELRDYRIIVQARVRPGRLRAPDRAGIQGNPAFGR
jgi:hypothetical protein